MLSLPLLSAKLYLGSVASATLSSDSLESSNKASSLLHGFPLLLAQAKFQISVSAAAAVATSPPALERDRAERIHGERAQRSTCSSTTIVNLLRKPRNGTVVAASSCSTVTLSLPKKEKRTAKIANRAKYKPKDARGQSYVCIVMSPAPKDAALTPNTTTLSATS